MIRPAAALALLLTATAASAQQVQYSSAHRDSERAIPQSVATVADAKSKLKLAANRTGTALVVADFDSDGTPDVISGYTSAAGGVLLLQRGAPAAHAPGPNEWAMTAAGQFVSPFRVKTESIDVPVSPDLLVTADVAGQGHDDLLLAAKGDTNLYVLFGRGNGAFTAPRAVPLAGTVTSLTTWKGRDGKTLAVAGVCGSSGCGLQFLNNQAETVAFVRTAAAVTSILSGRVDNGPLLDLVYVANGRAIVLDGDTALSPSPSTEKLPGGNVAAIALGSFVTDRRPLTQVAVLSTDATLHIFTRAGLDNSIPTEKLPFRGHPAPLPAGSRPEPVVKMTGTPWSEVETVSNVGSGGSSPLLIPAHLLVGGNDDLAVLSGNQYVTVAHRLSVANAHNITTPVVTIDSTASPVRAAAATRVNGDPRHSLLLLSGGPSPLVVATPPVNKTYTVNTTADGNDLLTSTGRCTGTGTCTLRDAVNLTNTDSATTVANGKIDVIILPAGTYTFSVNNPTLGTTTATQFDKLGSYNFHLEMDGPISLQGAGAASTIIDANNLDQILSIDGGAYYSTGSTDYHPLIMDAFISGVTLQHAKNPNSTSNASCSSGYCEIYGGAMSWLSYGGTGSNLVLSNVIVTNNQDTPPGTGNDGGAGIDAYLDTTSGRTTGGAFDVENSTFSNNYDHDGGGGGAIKAELHVPLIVNGSIISGNTTYDGVSSGIGGGIFFYPNDAVATMTISNSTVSGNASLGGGEGGGIFSLGVSTITGTIVSNNTAKYYGGGLYVDQIDGFPASSITGSTFTGNSVTATVTAGGVSNLQDGAGVCVEPSFGASAPPVLTFNYNRVHGNTTSVSGEANGLAVGCNSSGTTRANVSAINNWWGCNGAATGTGCDTAHLGNVTAANATLTLSPYTVLAISTNTPIASGSAITAIGGLYSNSSATVYTTAQDFAYAGVADTISITQSGQAASTSPDTLDATGKDTYSVTASAVGTGSASITLDGTTVSSAFTVTGVPTLGASSVHTGNFKTGDTADVYTLIVVDSGTTATSGTTTATDTLPAGFTAVSMSGSGWTCTLATTTCTTTAVIAGGSSFPAITLTVSTGSVMGTVINTFKASGGGASNTPTATDATIVVGQPTLAEAFSPTSISKSATSTVTFTVGNPAANSVSLTGVGFPDSLPSGLVIQTPSGATTTCGGSVAAAPGGISIALSGATIASGATCTVSVNVTSAIQAVYTNTTGTPTATNSNAGTAASAVLTVSGDGTTTVVNAPGATTGTVGGSTTISATVTDTSNPGTTPTGTVTFSNTVNGSTTTIGSSALVSGTATLAYPESYAGTNTITAVYVPTASFNASSDAVGKTITVTKVTPVESVGANDQAIQRNVASTLSFSIGYQGKVAPTGAITSTFNGVAIAGTPTCVAKLTGVAPHSNCSYANFTTTLAPGQYTFTYNQAADFNYNAYSGTSTVTVTP